MRRLTLMCIVLILPALLSADLYMKMEDYSEASYHHGTLEPERKDVSEQWVGEKRMAYITDNLHVILDLKAKKIFFGLRQDKTYVEGDLPIDLPAIVEEDVAPLLAMYKTTGTVEELKESRKVDGHPCRGYRVTTWIPYEGSRYNETERTAWFSTDFSMDWKVYAELYANMLRLNNMTDELTAASAAVKGIQMESQAVRYSEGQEVKSGTRLLELKEADAPEGTYTLPEDYTKKDRLSRDDLRQR